MKNRLIYVLNSYSEASEEHYFHAINFLDKLAMLGVDIALIIEKGTGCPQFNSDNIKVFIVSDGTQNKLLRSLRFVSLLRKLSTCGYNKIFVRISKSAIILSVIYSLFSRLSTYYWHSGTVFEFDKAHKSYKQLLVDKCNFWFIKTCVDKFVTGPESMKDYYISHGVKPDKIMILYNDIDIERFSEQNEMIKQMNKQKLGISSTDKVVLFVHRLSPVRQSLYYLPYVIEQFYQCERFQDYKFYIIGGGSDKEKLEKEIKKKELQSRVFVLGSKPNAVIQNFYLAADFFINPTMAEGFPRVIIEAMAVGLPIVTTNAGGISDILTDNQKNFMVDKNDRNAFADKMIEMASLNEEAMERLKKTNREFVKKYSTENVAFMYKKRIFES